MRVIGTFPEGGAVGLGIFDGVHRGHQTIVAQTDGIVTLFPHPDRVLRKNAEMPYLCSLVELAALVPRLVVLRFSSETAQLSAEVFLDMLRVAIRPGRIVVGSDFRFGYRHAGNVEVLQAWGRLHGIEVTVVPLASHHDTPIKSSNIRKLIEAGNVAEACALMGHSYPMFGRVIRGKGKGRMLGFPTANLRLFRNKCRPAYGVYAAEVELATGRRPAILYTGKRPTLGYGESVEVHIPGINVHLEGARLKVWISRKIRGDQKFESRDALIAQIRNDIRSLDQ